MQIQNPPYPYYLKITIGYKVTVLLSIPIKSDERQEKFSKKFLKNSWQYKKADVLYNQTTNKKAK